MKNKRILVISQYLITDPPTKNVVDALSNMDYDIHYVEQSRILRKDLIPALVNVKQVKLIEFFPIKAFRRLINLIYFYFSLNHYQKKIRPDVVIMIMYIPISLVKIQKDIKSIGVILDVPCLSIAGFYDRLILKNALNKLKKLDYLWCSDKFKAEITMKQGQLERMPLVCHNSPPLNYFINYKPNECRQWLLDKLIKNGITILSDAIIILRAGAIGPYGGIEETILSLKYLPSEIVFVLMGRPSIDYVNYIKIFTNKNEMSQRVFLMNKPCDSDWKKTLLGSDIGHMIHLVPPRNDKFRNVYDLNSSLSNNRLFQYMAAGLVILSYNDPRLIEIHNEGDCFVIVDVSKIVKNLTLALMETTNESKRRAMKKNSHELFLKRYNWEMQFKKIMELEIMS